VGEKSLREHFTPFRSAVVALIVIGGIVDLVTSISYRPFIGLALALLLVGRVAGWRF
jgi:hypothetical protein